LADKIQAVTRVRPAVYADYREMLVSAKPDAVSLTVPPTLNLEFSQAALAVGCHVIVEKPLATNLADGAQMLSWEQKYGRVLMIAENFRYVESFRHAARLVSQGVIGQPQVARWTFYAHMSAENPYYQTAWRQKPAHPGGFLSDHGVHSAAVFRMVLGEVESVTGEVAQMRADLIPADTLSATLRFANGCLGTYAITHAIPGPVRPLEIAGPEGVLMAWRDRVALWRDGAEVESWPLVSPADGLVAMYEDFAHAIRTGEPHRSPPAESLADLQFHAAGLNPSPLGEQLQQGSAL
jgi:predicted dehydrogenase